MSKYSSRDYFSLEFIPFVSSTRESKTITKNPIDHLHFASHFSGKEASDFYNSVIATPTTFQCRKSSSPKKQQKKLRTSVKTCEFIPNNILRYAQEGELNKIKECVDKNNFIIINQRDMYGWTPLMCATCEGHFNVVEYLIQSGADLNVKNYQDMTALDIAIKKRHFNIVELLKKGIQLKAQEGQFKEEKMESKETYCKDCKLFFKETKFKHDKSIAHLFSVKKSDCTTFYHIPENNKGFQMMVKSGWDQNKGLGSKEEGRKFPIKTVLKKDRSCIGKIKEVARVTHFDANDTSAIKKICDAPVKLVRERTLKKWQRAKMERINRQKEIEFRRQFICDF